MADENATQEQAVENTPQPETVTEKPAEAAAEPANQEPEKTA